MRECLLLDAADGPAQYNPRGPIRGLCLRGAVDMSCKGYSRTPEPDRAPPFRVGLQEVFWVGGKEMGVFNRPGHRHHGRPDSYLWHIIHRGITTMFFLSAIYFTEDRISGPAYT